MTDEVEIFELDDPPEWADEDEEDEKETSPDEGDEIE